MFICADFFWKRERFCLINKMRGGYYPFYSSDQTSYFESSIALLFCRILLLKIVFVFFTWLKREWKTTQRLVQTKSPDLFLLLRSECWGPSGSIIFLERGARGFSEGILPQFSCKGSRRMHLRSLWNGVGAAKAPEFPVFSARALRGLSWILFEYFVDTLIYFK